MQTIIAAHIVGDNLQENYLFVSLQKIANSYADCKIILFTTTNILCTATNIEIQNIGSKNTIAKAYWHTFTLPKILKNVHCFITNERLCNKTSIPQYFFIQEDISNTKKKSILKLQNARSIFVVEDYFKNHLERILPSNKIINLSHGLFTKPLLLNYNETKSIQGTYTNGYDYFLFFVNPFTKKDIIIVLKAFSIIKKWQKTSMKLVLLLDNIVEQDLIIDFKNYKYKLDIVFVKSVAENEGPIIASAFACIFLSDYNKMYNAFVALQNAIPIIAQGNPINKSVFNNAALYADKTDKSIAANMQQLYKDEQLKKELQIESQILLQKYDADKAAEDMYNIICTK